MRPEDIVIRILSPGCVSNALQRMAFEIMSAMGIAADIFRVHDPNEIGRFGVTQTPALIINNQLKSSGRMSTSARSKNGSGKWLTDRRLRTENGSSREMQDLTPNPCIRDTSGKVKTREAVTDSGKFKAKTMKQTLLLLLLLLQAIPARGATIVELLDAAASHPNVAISDLQVEEGRIRTEAVSAALYPRVSLFGKAEIYNSPTNLRPMAPTEVNVAAGDALPFSYGLMRYGLSFKVPLYAAGVYRLREKMTLLARKSVIARQINLVSREAAVVSLNSAYLYLDRLRDAVAARLKSLNKTRENIALKVKNGRTPEAELMKIDNSIIALEQQDNHLLDKVLGVQRDLEKFTGLALEQPVAMQLTDVPTGDDLVGVSLRKAELTAQEKEVERTRAAKLPSLSLYATISGNDGEAYNADDHIFRAYNFAGINLSFPVFDKTLNSDEKIARLQLSKARKQLQDTEIELAALEKNLKARLPIVENSLRLAEKSAANNNELLKIARVSYDSGRTTTEEYLRYEAQVLAAQADLAQAVDARWQIITKQAVLYGADLRGVIK